MSQLQTAQASYREAKFQYDATHKKCSVLRQKARDGLSKPFVELSEEELYQAVDAEVRIEIESGFAAARQRLVECEELLFEAAAQYTETEAVKVGVVGDRLAFVLKAFEAKRWCFMRPRLIAACLSA